MKVAWKPCIAELIGAFGLSFIGAGAICADALTGGKVGLLGIAVAHGLVLSIMVSATMHISGGHLNPAVTCAFVATKRMKIDMAGQYIIAQLVGAALAGFGLKMIFAGNVWRKAQLGTPMLAAGVSYQTGILVEAILTFFLVFAVFGTAVDGNAPKIGGFGIGLTIAFDILMGGPLTGASMNPSRTFGPALAGGYWNGHLVYWIGPIVGGVIAGLVYDEIRKR
ncbi:MAG TPA: aquaporin [Candidatus Polarisedimenticolia bacterium]|nr:aquaporin [Candidatus Polarisedimenticolia bacterium]